MERESARPPRWALRLLRVICPTRSFEEIEGDLTEEFYRDMRRFGAKRARREFAWNCIRYTRPEIILRNHVSLELNPITMLLNYLRIAFRNLMKQKALAFINVFGLAVGIGCFCLLLLFAVNEFSFDKFHGDAADIYRVYNVWDKSLWGNENSSQNEIYYTEFSSFKKQTLAEAMKEGLPDVVSYVQMQLPWGENLVQANNKIIHASVGFADPSFFSVFNFPLKYGNKATALHDVSDIALTSSRAKTIFGTDDVIGKTVEIQLGNSFYPFTISAVAEDVPENSSIRFDILGSFAFTESHNPDSFIIGRNWHPTVKQTYVQLKPGSTLPHDPAAMDRFLHTFTPLSMFKDMGVTNWTKKELPVTLKLQPLLNIHTDSWFNGWAFVDYAVINPKTIWILLTIAGGVLLIACINFTTLAIGRSAVRSKEVGVRKVIGAGKHQVVFQFYAEALLLSFFSAILGLMLAYLLLPWFNQLSGRNLSFSSFLYPQMILILISLVVVVGLMAGSYPALVLSSFKPVEVLKNKIRMGGSNLFTKSLVTFQFALSIILIVSTIIILQQTNYLINKTPGFNRENVVAIDATEVDANKIFPVFRQAVANNPEIVGVASAAAGLGAGNDLLGYSDQGLSAAVNIVDADYIKLLGMKLIAGRDFEPVAVNDTIRRVIINETMAHALGWTAQGAVGQEIKHFQGRMAHVIGVVKNFSYRPLSEGIKNQLFATSADNGYSHFYVRINSGNAAALNVIQKAWDIAAPGVPMKFSFLDEDISNYYRSEQRWSAMVGWAGGISIFLACLGLLGLVALAGVNRTKEVGIRKIMGASLIHIAHLLLKDFLNLIMIAFAIASPLAWYFMNVWLQDYANRITISWTIFLFVGIFAISIAFLTVIFQVIKVALMNPVNSLKSE
ncbi:MAG TPA: ABC transporter permease [Cyclobacteriaceae bacterium]|jgi:putative ABC transport system permease protein|nr:ABC transporter permease [Cyclobacteriaceae bacterium]